MYNITPNDLNIQLLKDNNYLESKNLYNIVDRDHILISYKKDKIDITNIETLGLYRQLIFNNNKLVCFSPPKSISYENFKNNYDISNVELSELIEGIMICLYYSNNKWKVSTKNGIELSEKINNMYLDAKCKCNLNYHYLNNTYCYNLILQHPKNRIVCPAHNPRLYITNVYSITSNIDNSISILPINLYGNEIYKLIEFTSRQVLLPRIYDSKRYSYDNIEDSYMLENNNIYSDMGIGFLKNNVRSKYINPLYSNVLDLRSNNPKLQFTYLSLRYNNKVKEYLKYFKEDRIEFSKYRKQIHKFTKQLFKYYIRWRINREKELCKYPYEYRTHMYMLHEIYINTLLSKKDCITYDKTVKYINNLEPAKLMFSINYNLRLTNRNNI